jgi:hypothetical protein
VSDFLGNLARRGAGLAPGVAPRPPVWPSSARRLKNTGAAFSEAPLEGDDALARGANSDMAAAPHARPDADLPQAAPRTVFAPAQLEPRSAPAADPGTHARAPMPAPSLGLAPPPFSASARLRFSQAVLRPVPASEWPASESKRTDAIPAMAPRIPDREPHDAAAIVAPARAAPVRGHAAYAPNSGPTMSGAPAMPPERQLARARQVPADSIPTQRGPGAPSRSSAAPETPSIHVRIGRIEVRAAPQAAAPARPATAKGSSGFAELRLARAHLDRTWR